MAFLVLRAYLYLIVFDYYLQRGNFAALYRKVRECPRNKDRPSPDAIVKVCGAVDMACVWYWKEVFCLQRSAVGACLLKRHGVAAQLIIGAQQVPFRAHAWVEVEGCVVNDKPYMREMYALLDRC